MTVNNVSATRSVPEYNAGNSASVHIKDESGSGAAKMEQNQTAAASMSQTMVDVSNKIELPEEETATRQGQEVSDTTVRQALKDINKKINHNTVAEFGFHEGTNRIMIKLKDKDTNKVIKEVPAEKTLDLIQKAWELAGILVDEKR